MFFAVWNGRLLVFRVKEASIGLCSLKSHRAPRNSYTPGGILSFFCKAKRARKKSAGAATRASSLF
jgi:hypothetical protein